MPVQVFSTSLFRNYLSIRLQIAAFLIISSFLYTPKLQADNHSLYTLPRIGGLILSSNNIDNIQIVGIVVGLRIDNALYLESELNTSVSGGDYFSATKKGQLQISNLNLYGVYRYVWNKNVYGKLKAGIAYKTLEYDNATNLTFANSNHGTGASAGAGIGFVYFVAANPAMLELEYTIIDKDIDMFTIGMTIPF